MGFQNTMLKIGQASAHAVLVNCAGIVLLAQSSPTRLYPDRGLLPTGTYSAGEFETINPVNGNLHLRMPLAAFPPGRPGSEFQLELLYDSGLYDIVPTLGFDNSTNLPLVRNELVKSNTGGWRYNFQNLALVFRTRQLVAPCASAQGTSDWIRSERVHGLSIGLLDGGLHSLVPRGYGDENGEGHIDDGYYRISPFGSIGSCQLPQPAPVTGHIYYYTTDGTFVQVDVDNTDDPATPNFNGQRDLRWTAHFPDGRRITGGTPHYPTTISDANGNRVTIINFCGDANCTTTAYTQITNQDNGLIYVEYNQLAPFHDRIRSRNNLGGFTDVSVWWTPFSPRQGSTYTCANQANGSPVLCPFGVGLNVVQTIERTTAPLATNFVYSDALWCVTGNCAANGYAGWGELRGCSNPFGPTPTGAASLEWRWEQDDGRPKQDPNNLLQNRITRRDLVHDGMTEQRSYTYQNTATTITGPDGGVTKYHYYDPIILSNWQRGLVYRIEHPSGDVTERLWSQNPVRGLSSTSLPTNPNNPFVSIESFTPAGASLPSRTITVLDKNGNLLSRADQGFGYVVNNPPPTGQVTVYDTLRTISRTYYVPASSAATIPATDSLEAQVYTWPAGVTARRLNGVKRQEVSGPRGTESVHEFSYDNPTSTGNVTEERVWDNTLPGSVTPGNPSLTAGQYISRNWSYNLRGDVLDASGAQLRVRNTYGPIPGCEATFVHTKTEQGYGTSDVRTFAKEWDCWSGMRRSETDQDNGITTFYSYDFAGRPLALSEGPRLTTMEYRDWQSSVVRKADLRIFGDGVLQSVTHRDALGRVRLIRRSDGAALSMTSETDGIKVQTNRRVVTGGFVEVESNPYRLTSDASMGWTCRQYDLAGRLTRTSWYSGATAPLACTDTGNRTGTALVSYSFDTVWRMRKISYQDADLKQEDEFYNGLGRLAMVVEHTNISSPSSYQTFYGYDARGNLRNVTQGVQVRTFQYDSVGRLSSASNPENGVVSYTYYSDGSLKSRTDSRTTSAGTPAPVTIGYTYDSLQRVVTKTYNGVLATTYSYYRAGVDQAPKIGKLKSIIDSGVTASYFDSYDYLGRLITLRRRVDGVDYSMAHSYRLNDELLVMIYPSSRVVFYDHDDAGRLTRAASSQFGGSAYASAASYAPHGALAQITLGNQLFERRKYDSRLQLSDIQLGTGAEGTVAAYNRLRVSHTYFSNGNLQTRSVTRGASQSWSESFTYDGVNRLQSATEPAGATSSPVWRQSYGYDQWGNRWLDFNCTQSPCNTGFVFDPLTATAAGAYNTGNNRLNLAVTTAYTDGVGNQTKAGSVALEYDEEGRVKKSTLSGVVTTYVYDGEGRRVKKETIGGTNPATTVYVYNAVGELVAEYSTAGDRSGLRYLATDGLGSTRALTDGAGTVVRCYDYLPFGEPLTAGRTDACFSGAADVPLRFTGKERDRETATSPDGRDALDYFGARYMSAAQGRFTSPDVPFADQDEYDPQSWNLYSYVRNNPLRFIDPTGQTCQKMSDGTPYDDMDGKGCATVDEANKNKKPDITVGVGWDQARLLMLAGIGENLSSPHQVATVVSGGFQGAATLLAPLPSAVAQCLTGNCSQTSLAMAMIPGGGNLKLGGKLLKIDPTKPLRAYLAGARLAKGGGFPEHLIDMTAEELKEALAKGLVTPDQVKKIAKVVEQGQRLMEKLGGK